MLAAARLQFRQQVVLIRQLVDNVQDHLALRPILLEQLAGFDWLYGWQSEDE